jgi:hypothetical protein
MWRYVRPSVHSRNFFRVRLSCCLNLTRSPYKIKNPAGHDVADTGATGGVGELPRRGSAASMGIGTGRVSEALVLGIEIYLVPAFLQGLGRSRAILPASRRHPRHLSLYLVPDISPVATTPSFLLYKTLASHTTVSSNRNRQAHTQSKQPKQTTLAAAMASRAAAALRTAAGWDSGECGCCLIPGATSFCGWRCVQRQPRGMHSRF